MSNSVRGWRIFTLITLVILSVFAALLVYQSTQAIVSKRLVVEVAKWGVTPENYSEIPDQQIQDFIETVSTYSYLEIPEYPFASPKLMYARNWAEGILNSRDSSIEWLDVKIGDEYYHVEIKYMTDARYYFASYISFAAIAIVIGTWIVFGLRHFTHY